MKNLCLLSSLTEQKKKNRSLMRTLKVKGLFKSLCRLKEATYIYLEYVPLAKYVFCVFEGNWVKWPWLRQKGQTKRPWLGILCTTANCGTQFDRVSGQWFNPPPRFYGMICCCCWCCIIQANLKLKTSGFLQRPRVWQRIPCSYFVLIFFFAGV